ncbi:MAG: response regulator transcription factor [Lewinella sp.]|nr:response regulator transcription factor [Lewinella sp.]
MQYRVLLVDDEHLALKLLEAFLAKVPDMVLVGKCQSPLEALRILQQEPVDLLFLDIQMPSLNGMDLLRQLPHPPVTIFTTAYREHAVDAFELQAIDYLVKPFAYERFLQALQQARAAVQQRRGQLIIPRRSKDFFTVKVDGLLTRVHIDEILFVEGLKEYVRIVCQDDRLVTLERLKNIEELLPESDFLRVHRSYIVGRRHVKALEGNLLHVGPHKIPVSRQRREAVVEALFLT